MIQWPWCCTYCLCVFVHVCAVHSVHVCLCAHVSVGKYAACVCVSVSWSSWMLSAITQSKWLSARHCQPAWVYLIQRLTAIAAHFLRLLSFWKWANAFWGVASCSSQELPLTGTQQSFLTFIVHSLHYEEPICEMAVITDPSTVYFLYVLLPFFFPIQPSLQLQ